jgi:hypothetical protein
MAVQYPIPPSFSDPAPEPAPVPVPTWALRAPAPARPEVAPPGEPDLDPMSLRRRVTLRCGAATLTIDDAGLALRAWWSRREFAWSEVDGFEQRLVDRGRTSRRGRLVAHTHGGPVELAATRSPRADLPALHALLDAYRRRAQLLSDD